jgi:hypothetical protein
VRLADLKNSKVADSSIFRIQGRRLQSVNGGEKLLLGELAPLVQAICNRMGQEEFKDGTDFPVRTYPCISLS